MNNLSTEQKIDIALEMIKKEPAATIGQLALLKLAELGINMNSEETTLSTEATVNQKRYKCKMIVTWEKI